MEKESNSLNKECPLKTVAKSELVEDLQDCICVISDKKVKECGGCNGG